MTNQSGTDEKLGPLEELALVLLENTSFKWDGESFNRGWYANNKAALASAIAKHILAAIEATREHMQADPDVTPCDDAGDGKTFGPNCLADIASRILDNGS